MDEFGVLVESIGFKSQSRSTPLSKLKSQPNKPNYPQASSTQPPVQTQSSGAADVVDLDAFFNHHNPTQDDIFSLNSTNNDLLSGFSHPTTIGGNSETGNYGKSSAPSYSSSTFAEDPLSVFESSASHVKEYPGRNSSPIDELEAFAMGSSHNNRSEGLDVKISNEAITRVQEKLSNLKHLGQKGNAASHGNIKLSLGRKEGRDSKVTPGSQHYSQREKVSVRGHSNEAKKAFRSEDSFGSWFSKDSRTNISRGPKSEIEDPVLDSLFSGRNQSNVENPSSQALHGTKRATSSTKHVDDFLYFGEPVPSAVEFLEIEGEPEERRRARYNQHMKTKERMAKALSEKNRRDLQAHHEQEERRSLAESMDNNIKRWAAGKVGNLRALLSSLQYVLWPECGWQPVSLTDMITSVSVKKVYHKATLCVHPDKVQQKGATIQQKYIAEKVFDLLKEAWNKFNAEELR
ncbi:membrane traffic protein [Lithospermum erythrorhizon]|uniref:Membrane traffic protein n=1 Tax=Lithospermum erythrorhizon TaxID=34254 RepID=A0AAV3NNQ1_LITER